MIDTELLTQTLAEVLENRSGDSMQDIARLTTEQYLSQTLDKPASDLIELVAACKIIENTLSMGKISFIKQNDAVVVQIDTKHTSRQYAAFTFAEALVQLAKRIAR